MGRPRSNPTQRSAAASPVGRSRSNPTQRREPVGRSQECRRQKEPYPTQRRDPVGRPRSNPPQRSAAASPGGRSRSNPAQRRDPVGRSKERRPQRRRGRGGHWRSQPPRRRRLAAHGSLRTRTTVALGALGPPRPRHARAPSYGRRGGRGGRRWTSRSSGRLPFQPEARARARPSPRGPCGSPTRRKAPHALRQGSVALRPGARRGSPR